MPIDAAVLSALAVSGIGAIVWLIRLEGRVNTGEALFGALKDSHAELKDDVRYIRDRIDRAIGKP